MHHRSPGARSPSTRRRRRRIVPLKAVWPLAILVLARPALSAGPDQACFPVSMAVRADGAEEHDGYVEGWAFVDPAVHFEGRTCQVKGWVSIHPCGRTITAYLANCPDGAFTFVTTEADCRYVIGCSDGSDGAARQASR